MTRRRRSAADGLSGRWGEVDRAVARSRRPGSTRSGRPGPAGTGDREHGRERARRDAGFGGHVPVDDVGVDQAGAAHGELPAGRRLRGCSMLLDMGTGRTKVTRRRVVRALLHDQAGGARHGPGARDQLRDRRRRVLSGWIVLGLRCGPGSHVRRADPRSTEARRRPQWSSKTNRQHVILLKTGASWEQEVAGCTASRSSSTPPI